MRKKGLGKGHEAEERGKVARENMNSKNVANSKYIGLDSNRNQIQLSRQAYKLIVIIIIGILRQRRSGRTPILYKRREKDGLNSHT
jgi:hypothetical protein